MWIVSNNNIYRHKIVGRVESRPWQNLDRHINFNWNEVCMYLVVMYLVYTFHKCVKQEIFQHQGSIISRHFIWLTLPWWHNHFMSHFTLWVDGCLGYFSSNVSRLCSQCFLYKLLLCAKNVNLCRDGNFWN